MDPSELGTQPISEANPAGEDIRHSQEYDALHAEMDKLSKLTSDGKPIDWENVQQIAEGILAQKSKDILVAAYLAAAWQENKGLQGVADGATLLQQLTATFWENMFPPKKRKRGRLNAFSWWKERTNAFLQDNTPEEAQPPQLIDDLKNALQALDQTLGEATDDAPILRDLLEQAQRIPVAEPEPEPEPAAQPTQEETAPAQGQPSAAQDTAQPAQQAAAPVQSAPAPPSDVSGLDASDADKLLQQGLDTLSAYRDWMFTQNPKDPRCYRINRWAAWSKIQQLPPVDGAFTRIPPPDEQIRATLEQMLSQSQYEQALRKAENHVPEYLFWLDLSYTSAKALKNLGDEWQAALDAVEAETAYLVQRLSGIENQSFNDGTPFCNEETANWLASLAQGSGAGDTGSADSVEQAVKEAEQAAAGQDIVGGLKRIDQGLAAHGLLRDRFRLQVGMLKLLSKTENQAMASVYADDLVRTIDDYHLEQWEPALALEGLQNAYLALRATQEAELQQRAQTIFSRMVRMSPASALRFAGMNE